jgi:hypothetical protein
VALLRTEASGHSRGMGLRLRRLRGLGGGQRGAVVALQQLRQRGQHHRQAGLLPRQQRALAGLPQVVRVHHHLLRHEAQHHAHLPTHVNMDMA